MTKMSHTVPPSCSCIFSVLPSVMLRLKLALINKFQWSMHFFLNPSLKWKSIQLSGLLVPPRVLGVCLKGKSSKTWYFVSFNCHHLCRCRGSLFCENVSWHGVSTVLHILIQWVALDENFLCSNLLHFIMWYWCLFLLITSSFRLRFLWFPPLS